MKNIILLAFFLFNFSMIATAGPWPQPKGKGYFKLSEWWVVFDKHYTDQGRTDPNVTTGIFNTTLYGEFGFHDRVTGLVNATLIGRTFVNDVVSGTNGNIIIPGNDATSLGDIDLGVKYAITKPGSKIPVAATLVLGIPSGNDFIENPESSLTGILQTGDGEFNQMLEVSAGYGFSLLKGVGSYVSAYTAYNNRTKGFSNEFRWGAELGASILNNKIWLIGRVNSLSSLNDGEDRQENPNTSIFANNTEFFSYGVEIAAYITKKIGVSATYATASSGKLIAASPSYSVGIFYDMNRK